MKKTVGIIFIILATVACGKNPPFSGGVTQSNVPGGCSFAATETHDFINWSSETADKYECSLYSKMTCYYFENDEHREIQCQVTDESDPQGPPARFDYFASGTHGFLDGSVLIVDAYDGGSQYDGLSCNYYVHSADNCDSTDADPTNDCASYEDNHLHEEITCI